MFKRLFVLLFFCFFAFAKAQQIPVHLKFSEGVTQADEFGNISSMVELSNTAGLLWTGSIRIEASSTDLRITSSTNRQVQINQGQRIFIPIIAHVDQSTSSEQDIFISVKILNDLGQILQVAQQKVSIQKNRRILLLNLEKQLQFEKVGDSVSLKAIIQNKGNTSEALHYVLTLPSQLNKQRTISNQISLAAQRDTIIVYKYIISKEALKLEDFDINATLLYQNGDFISRTNYSVSSLKSKRRFKIEDSNNDPNYQRNAIELNRVTGNNVMTSFELIGSTDIYLSEKTKIGLTGDLLYWDQENKYNLRHFLADFKTEKIQIQAGNIYQTGEFSLQGRGIQSKIKLNDSISLKIGYLDKTYLITDPTDRTIGYNTWFGFESLKHKWKQSDFYYDLNHRYNEKKMLWFNAFNLFNTSKLDVEVTHGISNIDTRQDNQLGLFLGVNAYARWEKYQLQTNSFFGSPYYAGIRQGASQISSSFRRNFDKHSIGLTQSFIKYAPKYSYTDYNNSRQESNTVGLNYSIRFKSSTFLVSPRFVNEKRYNYNTQGIDNLNAIRLNTTFNEYNYKSGLGFNLAGDLGTYISENALKKNLHYRINAGLNYKAFDLGLSYQFNYSNLSEVINYSYLNLVDKDTYTNLMLMGNYKQRFFNNYVGVLLGAYYTKTSTSDDLWQINSRIEYKITKDFDLYLTTYNNYGGYSSTNKTNYIQLGAIKQLMPYRVYQKSYNLKVIVFYKDQNNHIQVASNRIVYINNKPFITDNQGVVEYKRLPVDSYIINVVNDKQWFANTDKVVLNSDLVHEIYLKQTTSILGSIKYQYSDNAYTISKNLSGQRIVAQNSLGENFTSYTSDQGQYILYVPQGEYVLTIYPENNNYVEILDNSVKINTQINKPKTTDFIIKIKDKEVQTKKFNPISF